MNLKEQIKNRMLSFKTKTLIEDKPFDEDDLPTFKVTSVNAIKKRKLSEELTADLPKKSKIEDITYFLLIPEEESPQEGRLNYDFNILVKDVKTMKLPSPEWRIKIMIKKQAITGIVFTDKKESERSVTFSSKLDTYKISIDKKTVILLGSPPTINSIQDVESLLEIMEHISSDDPMLLYK